MNLLKLRFNFSFIINELGKTIIIFFYKISLSHYYNSLYQSLTVLQLLMVLFDVAWAKENSIHILIT